MYTLHLHTMRQGVFYNILNRAESCDKRTKFTCILFSVFVWTDFFFVLEVEPINIFFFSPNNYIWQRYSC